MMQVYRNILDGLLLVLFMPVSLHMELKFYREESRKIIKDIKLPNAEVILVNIS